MQNSSKLFIYALAISGACNGFGIYFSIAAGLSAYRNDKALSIDSGVIEIFFGCAAIWLCGYLIGITNQQSRHDRKNNSFYGDETVVRNRYERAEFGLKTNVSNDDLHNNPSIYLHKEVALGGSFLMLKRCLQCICKHLDQNNFISVMLSFSMGSFLPMIIYRLISYDFGMLLSTVFLTVGFFLFGYIKSKINGDIPIIGAIKASAFGLIVYGSTFFIATLIC